MKFTEFSKKLAEIEAESSRNEIGIMLAEFLHSLEDKEVDAAVYMLDGRLAPRFIDIEFAMSEGAVMKALSKFSGQGLDSVKLLRKEIGDIGDVTSEIVSGQGDDLEILDLYRELGEMAVISGAGSVEHKTDMLVHIFERVDSLSAKYLSRLIAGKLRLGLDYKGVLEALSVAVVGDKSLKDKLSLAYGIQPDLGYLVRNTLAHKGVDQAMMGPVVGIPLLPRLVQRVPEFSEVYDRFEEGFVVQAKLDGFRCQIHKGVDYSDDIFEDRLWSSVLESSKEDLGMFTTSEREDIKLFSRSLEDTTHMFPEVVEAVKDMSVKSLILDGEVIGWDIEHDRVAPFQDTISRKRKTGISEAMEAVPVKYFAFDLMYLNGDSYVLEDTQKRLGSMVDGVGLAAGTAYTINMLESHTASDLDTLMEIFEETVADGHEGLIAKSLKSSYLPGTRNYEWIKLKKSMDKKLVDSVDLVIMGFYRGSGKRAQFGLGALLAGIYDEETGSFQSATKIGTGMSDEQLSQIFARLDPISEEEIPSNYDVKKDMFPDVWVLPEVTVSVEADEITNSKLHTAAAVGDGLGLALRFPRLIEFDRDKKPEDVTSSEELRDMVSLWAR